jgi:hypothetical protein
MSILYYPAEGRRKLTEEESKAVLEEWVAIAIHDHETGKLLPWMALGYLCKESYETGDLPRPGHEVPIDLGYQVTRYMKSLGSTLKLEEFMAVRSELADIILDWLAERDVRPRSITVIPFLAIMTFKTEEDKQEAERKIGIPA